MRRQQVFVVGMILSLSLFVKPDHIHRVITLLKPIRTQDEDITFSETEFYLFVVQLGLFVVPIFVPSHFMTSFVPFLGSNVFAWGMAVTFCVVYALFDSSISLWDEVGKVDATTSNQNALRMASDQRQLYLSLINLVLLICNLRSYLMLQALSKTRKLLMEEKAKVEQLTEEPWKVQKS